MKLPSPLARGLSLATFMGVFAVLLFWSSHKTQARIDENFVEDRRKLLREVIPAELYDAPLDREPVSLQVGSRTIEYLVGRKNGQVTSFAFETQSMGYSGPIKSLVGVSPEGTILGVRVIAHSETPGLGDQVEAAKTDWVRQFDGKSLSNPNSERWLVKKDGGDFDAISGATITPRAVVYGVKMGLSEFQVAKTSLPTKEPEALEK